MKRIVITGPEASGKSALTLALSNELNALKVHEYARWYLPSLHRPYIFEDLLAICRGQEIKALDKMHDQKQDELLFIDTWAIVLMIWAEYKFKKSHPAFKALLDRYKIDHFLLCAPDIPWTEDPLRENPHDREELFELYHEQLQEFQLPYTIVSGQGKERITNAVHAIKGLN